MAQPPRVVPGREGTTTSSVLIDPVCSLATTAARGVTGATTTSGALDGADAGVGASDAPSAAVRTDLVVAGSGGARSAAAAAGVAVLDGTSLTAKVLTLTGLIGASEPAGTAAVASVTKGGHV